MNFIQYDNIMLITQMTTRDIMQKIYDYIYNIINTENDRTCIGQNKNNLKGYVKLFGC